MGEIDTKPIESVESAITFFGQSNEQRRSIPTRSNEKEVGDIERELASVEAKDAVHKQALVKLDQYQKTADELSALLKKSDVKKNLYIKQAHEGSGRVAQLESALEQKSERVSELERGMVEKCGMIDSLQQAMAAMEGEKTALYKALQQMGLEAEETKKENRMLKMPKEGDLMVIKRELEVALARIAELRTRAEQATTRAEAAEKALQDHNRRRRDHKDRRNAALSKSKSVLNHNQEDLSAKIYHHNQVDLSAKIYQPLGKVLNMKF